MAFNELEQKRIERALARYLAKHRPPPDIRHEVDIHGQINGQSVELTEMRPVWRGKPGEFTERPFAKATFVRTQQTWKLYWMRANLRWHAYDPPTASSINEVIGLIDEDHYGCFRG